MIRLSDQPTSAPRRGHPATSRHPRIQDAWQKGLAALRPSPRQLEEGLELHRHALSLDTFGFLPVTINQAAFARRQAMVDAGLVGSHFQLESAILHRISPTLQEDSGQEFREALHCSGLSGMVHTAAEGKSLEHDIRHLAASVHVCQHFGEVITRVHRPDDFLTAHREERFGVAFSVNGPPCPGHLINAQEELQWLETWYQFGVRMMHLTYNRQNVIGTGCAEPYAGGLSELGHELVRAMNRIGIVVDVPHSNENTVLQAAAASEKPIMASHTGCLACYDHFRNKSDRALRAIADTGGVVGIVGIGHFLGLNATLQTLLDHVDHAIRVVGIDHVSIGSDLCHWSPWLDTQKPYPAAPASHHSDRWWGAWNQAQARQARPSASDIACRSLSWTNWPLFTVGLLMRGHSQDAVEKLIGLNLLRVLRANAPAAGSPLKSAADPQETRAAPTACGQAGI